MLDLGADAEIFLAEYGEPITYHPRTGASRVIQAIVDRSPPAPLGPPGTLAAVLTITVANDAVTGISSAAMDLGADQVELPLRVGATPERRRIRSPSAQDPGMLTLEVR